MRNILVRELEQVTSSGMNNFGRSIEVRNPKLFKWVYNQTNYFPTNFSFNERVYCINNNYIQPLRCKISNNYLKFINYNIGYSKYAEGVSNTEIVQYYLNQVPVKLTKDEIQYLENNSKKIVNTAGKFIRTNILAEKIYTNTAFLPTNATLSERIYCVLADVNTYQPDKTYVSIVRGYVNKKPPTKTKLEVFLKRNAKRNFHLCFFRHLKLRSFRCADTGRLNKYCYYLTKSSNIIL